MTLVMLRDDLMEINRALVEAESTRDRAKRAELLEQALRASARAVEGLRKEFDLAARLAEAQDAAAPYEDAIGTTWEDAMLFQAFLEAERRLFRDLGLDTGTTDRLVAEIRNTHALSDWKTNAPKTVEENLTVLTSELSNAMERLRDEEEHRARIKLVRRGFLVVGGAFVVGANALVGAGTAPVTGGLSIAGAAVSASAGGVMIDRGFSD